MDFRSYKNKDFDCVELFYRCFRTKKWYCRIWRKDWVNNFQAYPFAGDCGKNKHEAYRNAVKKINNER
jgi:hypothetical protein